MASLTGEIARYAAATNCDSLPGEVREQAKIVIFDEVASAVFGRRSLAGGLTASYVQSLGTRPEAQVFGGGFKASAAFAAMANGAAGHGEEVDGAHTAGGHPGASIVHAGMAMAEMQRCGGAELINAVVLGYDVGVRLRWACGGSFGARQRLHLHADFLYALGAAAAASRLMGHDAERIGHALALGTFQANGLYATYAEHRHISKSFCEGQYAYAGVSAAMMAAAGLEGHEDIIGARAGLLDAWGEAGARDMAGKDLGRKFSIMDACIKFFNAGYPIHAALEAALDLAREHRIKPDQIRVLNVGMNANARRIVDGRAMHNICLQDMLAANLARGGLRLSEEPFPGLSEDPVFRALRACITVEGDPRFDENSLNRLGARVTIGTEDGKTVTRTVDQPRGYASNGRVGWDDLEGKWSGNLPNCDLDDALALARDLQNLDDVALLARSFSGA